VNEKSGPARILLVEDETYVRNVACEILESEGYQVFTASTAKEALSTFDQREPIDLLLTDIVMPGMSGQDLARQLTSRVPGLKTLFMSGYTDGFVSQTGQEWRRSFIQKPFTLEGLTTKVKEVLRPACG
jgi:DNA-binding NtrC family response regulator